MIDNLIERIGIDFELQKKIKTSQGWQGDTWTWEKVEDVRGALELASGKEVEYLQRLSVNATHILTLQFNTNISVEDRLVNGDRIFQVQYINKDLGNYSRKVRHLELYLLEVEND